MSIIKEKEKVLLELMGPQSTLEERNKVIKNSNITEKYLNLNFDFDNSKKNDFLIYENNDLKNLEKKKKENNINEIKANAHIQNLNDNISQIETINFLTKNKTENININYHILNMNNSNNNNINNIQKKNLIKEKKTQKNYQQESTYINYLVTSAQNLLQSGKITLEYLNTPEKKIINKIKTEINNLKLKKCSNKICSKYFEPTNLNSYYCKECYNAYIKGDYCFYCGIIYRDFKGNETNNDDKSWIQCDYCHKWDHIQCESEKGVFKNLSQLNKNDNFKYICPICRIKNHNKKGNKKNKFKGFIRKNKIVQSEIYEDILEILKLNGNGNK